MLPLLIILLLFKVVTNMIDIFYKIYLITLLCLLLDINILTYLIGMVIFKHYILKHLIYYLLITTNIIIK